MSQPSTQDSFVPPGSGPEALQRDVQTNSATESNITRTSAQEQIDDLEGQITKKEAQIKNDSGLITGVTIVAIFGLFGTYFLINFVQTWGPVIGWPLLLLSLFLLLVAQVGGRSNKSTHQGELQGLQRRLDNTRALAGITSGKPSHFDALVDINIRNLDASYDQTLKQGSRSFNAWLTVSAIGFIFIVIALSSFFVIGPTAELITFVSGAAGVLFEVVAALMVTVWRETLKQQGDFHKSQSRVQNILIAFRLLEDVESEEQRVKLLAIMLPGVVGGSSQSTEEKKEVTK